MAARFWKRWVHRDYVKCWAGPWHFIWDNRNQWIVLGLRTGPLKEYRYKKFGPFNLVVSNRKAGDFSQWDIWLRFRWGGGKDGGGFRDAMLGRLW